MLTKKDIVDHVKSLRSSEKSTDHKSADIIEAIYSQLQMADEEADCLRWKRE